MYVTFSQYEKPSEPIDSTPSGIVIVSKSVHLKNARFPITLTDDGISTKLSSEQSLKHESAISVTESGI